MSARPGARRVGNAAVSSVVADVRRTIGDAPSAVPRATAAGRLDLSRLTPASVQHAKRSARSVVPIPPLMFTGPVERAVGHANRRIPALNGKTTAKFHSTSRTEDLTTEPGEHCRRCRGPSCVHVTGTLVSQFTVTTHVTLPRPPRGLPECERQQVQDVIDTTLADHEQQHVDAFETYNGTVETPIELTMCRGGVQQTIRSMHNAEDRTRRRDARAASAALDPFRFNFNIERCG
jgi:hypothetical protein